jgi:hypothetical protein
MAQTARVEWAGENVRWRNNRRRMLHHDKGSRATIWRSRSYWRMHRFRVGV